MILIYEQKSMLELRNYFFKFTYLYLVASMDD
jgi:hypothetical protein